MGWLLTDSKHNGEDRGGSMLVSVQNHSVINTYYLRLYGGNIVVVSEDLIHSKGYDSLKILCGMIPNCPGEKN